MVNVVCLARINNEVIVDGISVFMSKFLKRGMSEENHHFPGVVLE